MIYVIGPNGSSVAKIGFTDGKPSKRLVEIQIGNPAALAVLWAGDGSKDLEGKLHTTFRPYHVRGEWYDFGVLDPVEEVQAAISSISRGVVHVVPTGRLPNCVCGHKRGRHDVNGCTLYTGPEEWQECQCSAYTSEQVLEDVSPLTRVPEPRPAVEGSAGPASPERKAITADPRYTVALDEIPAFVWPEGGAVVPGWHQQELAECIVRRLLQTTDPARQASVVLDEIMRMRWAHGGPMVPGTLAEQLTDQIMARLS